MLALLVTHWFGGRGVTVQGEIAPVNITTKTATILRTIVLICVAYYIIVGIALHFLEPEYDPRFHFMSDYAWGAYGWLMTTTFFVLGLAVLTVAVGIRDVHQSSRSARIGFGLLVIGALFVCFAGVFRGFPFTTSLAPWDSKPRHGGAVPVLELSERGGMAGDPSGHPPDRRWNVRCGRVDDPRRRDARVATAGFPLPVAIMAFNRDPPLGSGSSSVHQPYRPTTRTSFAFTLALS